MTESNFGYVDPEKLTYGSWSIGFIFDNNNLFWARNNEDILVIKDFYPEYEDKIVYKKDISDEEINKLQLNGYEIKVIKNSNSDFHFNIINSNKDYFASIYGDKDKKQIYNIIIDSESNFLGRIGEVKQTKIVSFWNGDCNKNDLIKCVDNLYKENLIDENFYISTYDTGTFPIKYISYYDFFKNRTADISELKKMINLHLMNSEEKKDYLTNKGWKPRQINNSLPGVKSWAPTSENFKLDFYNWFLTELSTSTSSVATFSMPIFSSPLKTRKKPRKIALEGYQPLSNVDKGLESKPLNPNETIPVQNNVVYPVRDEISISQYFGGNIKIFARLLEMYNENNDKKIKIALLRAINGNDYDMLKLCENLKGCSNKNLK